MSESPVPTPAETIRRAAEEMRQLANAATGGRWYASTEDEEEFAVESDVAAVACYFSMADAEHVASWQPTVALAVAAWLDVELADMNGYFEERDQPTVLSNGQVGWSYFEEVPNSSWTAAYTLARAYLGEVS